MPAKAPQSVLPKIAMDAPPRLLLVDDDIAFLEVTAKMLNAAGFSVDCAHDAHEALGLLRSETEYDVLITDREMPGNDRLALIRNMPAKCAGLPVILITAYPTVDSAIQALQLTVVAYVVKPVEKGELLAHVAHALELSRARRLLQSSRNRLSSWREELGKLDTAMRQCPGEIIDSAREAWFAINLEHMRQALLEMKAGVEAASQDNAAATTAHVPGAPAFGLRTAEQLALLGGLRETIEVLEKTKRSFRSRELGDLRKRLDGLFQQAPAPSTGAPHKTT